jgi:hypothetical protein
MVEAIMGHALRPVPSELEASKPPHSGQRRVRFGSLADITAPAYLVCFVPQADISRRRRGEFRTPGTRCRR